MLFWGLFSISYLTGYLAYGNWKFKFNATLTRVLLPLILSRIYLSSDMDIISFKMHFNIFLPSRPSLPRELFPMGLCVRVLKTLPFSLILATFPAYINLLNLITMTIRWIVQIFPPCEASFISIFIPLKYSSYIKYYYCFAYINF